MGYLCNIIKVIGDLIFLPISLYYFPTKNGKFQEIYFFEERKRIFGPVFPSQDEVA